MSVVHFRADLIIHGQVCVLHSVFIHGIIFLLHFTFLKMMSNLSLTKDY